MSYLNDMKRILSIDFVRGLVMIIMALDHVRDLIHIHSVIQSPTDLSTTTPVLFFTRWITYLCAPIFVFLAGTSAYLSSSMNADIKSYRRFLFQRGVWLILLEFIVVNFGLYFDLGYHTILFEVIASTGLGFIMLGFILKLPAKTIGIIGVAILFSHNLAALIPLSDTSIIKQVLMPFFAPGAFSIGSRTVIMGYPPIPWLGIMLLGFGAGKIFQWGIIQRKRLWLNLGLASILLFLIIRFINIYGDSAPWSVQKNPALTILSFLNVSKYPPSLVFCLVTLGIMFLIFAYADGIKNKFIELVSVYGRVPLFYFLIHFYFIHIILIVIILVQGFDWSSLDFTSGQFGRPKGVESGLSLIGVYLVWIAVVIILYLPCYWYGKFKRVHTNWWLKYL